MAASVAATTAEVNRPDDPALAGFARLLEETFADPDVVLGLDRLREFLVEGTGVRRFHVLVAPDPGAAGAVLGGVAFSYVPAANCGFSEYLVVARRARGRGVARELMAARRETLDADARTLGRRACRGVFVEVEHPERTSAAVREAERETALDADERWRFFHAMGFRRVDVPYVQPPLAPGKHAVDYLALLFQMWQAWDAPARTEIPSAWVREAVRPVWARWAPTTYEAELRRLEERLGGGTVRLIGMTGDGGRR